MHTPGNGNNESYIGMPSYGRIYDLDHTAFTGAAGLLEECAQLFKQLDLLVVHEDIEGGEYFSYELSDLEIQLLHSGHTVLGLGAFDRASISRIEESPGFIMGDNYAQGYSNNLGDMTIWINLDRGGIITAYSLVVFMDLGRKEALLSKHVSMTEGSKSEIAQTATHLLHLAGDPLEKSTDLNEINTNEYNSLLGLVRTIRHIL